MPVGYGGLVWWRLRKQGVLSGLLLAAPSLHLSRCWVAVAWFLLLHFPGCRPSAAGTSDAVALWGTYLPAADVPFWPGFICLSGFGPHAETM